MEINEFASKVTSSLEGLQRRCNNLERKNDLLSKEIQQNKEIDWGLIANVSFLIAVSAITLGELTGK
ncbi:hypothetical protein [Companilactobacillus jidongensis]|uniref:hypothetical protein n=1 Tax=Companilactobacillus jidongensis TaxID=2486006 RepID=UPI000F7B014A|nr:hypothetical protein [Companilactobacillus jidongensis]